MPEANNWTLPVTAETTKTFIIDCPRCKAKVAAIETGCAEQGIDDPDYHEPYCCKVLIGNCPRCRSVLVGETEQFAFEGINAYADKWTDVVRVYPKPTKTFSSYRIPRVLKDSLNEADRALQAGANMAACLMFGRALEALCRDVLSPKTSIPETDTVEITASPKKPPKKIMLGMGIKKLKEEKIIDERLYNWSQELQAFRNIAAHPEDISISREDTEDMQTFVYAIVEYIYDLADRYDEFQDRAKQRVKFKKIKS